VRGRRLSGLSRAPLGDLGVEREHRDRSDEHDPRCDGDRVFNVVRHRYTVSRYTLTIVGEIAQVEPIAAEELRQVARFRLALRHFERQTDRVLARCGLTPQRYLLLLAIEAQSIAGTVSVTSLARGLEMSQSTVSDLVSRAYGVGLVERTRADTDGRVVRLSLTSEGRCRLHAAVDGLRDGRGDLRETLIGLSRLI
jgi:DNA-binding MarR family transcriptional regulator